MLRGANVGLESGEQSKRQIWKSSERKIDSGHFCTNVMPVRSCSTQNCNLRSTPFPSPSLPLFYILHSAYRVYLFYLPVCSHLSLLHHISSTCAGRALFFTWNTVGLAHWLYMEGAQKVFVEWVNEGLEVDEIAH